jgi:integrase
MSSSERASANREEVATIAALRAGDERTRFHDLRHTHASLALAAGVHPKIVSERLGHANVGITLDTYSHAIPAMQEDAAAKVAALISG